MDILSLLYVKMFNLSLNTPSQCIKESSKIFFFNVKDKINYELTNLKKEHSYYVIKNILHPTGNSKLWWKWYFYIKVFFSDYDNVIFIQ